MTIERFLQDTFERLVVLRFLEQRQSRHGPIEDVKANTSRTDTGTSGHLTSLTYTIVRIKSCVPWPVKLQTFRENALEGLEIGFLVENGGARIATIQGMIQPACFIGSGWSWHP